MLGVIKRFFAERRLKATAIDVALRHFESSTGESGIRPMCAVLHRDAKGSVVRVCYGNTRPPRRTWFFIASDGIQVSTMTFDDVVAFGEKPWW